MFGLYLHIPYCIQRCHYCDFTTFEQSQMPKQEIYVEALCNEINFQLKNISYKKLDTIYFGGGTPSLLQVNLLDQIFKSIRGSHLEWGSEIEITMEMNPATVDEEKLKAYLDLGVNRISLGAQSFDDSLLKICGREHSAEDTRKSIRLLKKYDVNYSFDLLFGLPTQNLSGLKKDLKEALDFDPNHVSAYCLTLPEKHFMNKGRGSDSAQNKMFQTIEETLKLNKIYKYEISNFSKENFESKHNLLYWTRQAYLGLGLSAHSYLPKESIRFWNEKNLSEYLKRCGSESYPKKKDHLYREGFFEKLSKPENLTDFCHTSLRLKKGLDEYILKRDFLGPWAIKAEKKLISLQKQGLIHKNKNLWSLSKQGVSLSNQVFLELTFLKDDIFL